MRILNDFSTSVIRALEEINPDFDQFPGLIVCGTHKPELDHVFYMLDEIKIAREKNTPFLGICFGLQLMVIEFCRNVLGITDAISPEIGTGKNVIIKMPELRVGLQPALWGNKITLENFWHNYRVNIQEFPVLWDYFAITEANDVVSAMRAKDYKYHYGVQFHPEYDSSKGKPHPILVDFLKVCSEHRREG